MSIFSPQFQTKLLPLHLLWIMGQFKYNLKHRFSVILNLMYFFIIHKRILKLLKVLNGKRGEPRGLKQILLNLWILLISECQRIWLNSKTLTNTSLIYYIICKVRFWLIPWPSSMTNGACRTDTTLNNVVAPRFSNSAAVAGSRLRVCGLAEFQVPKFFLLH